MAEAKSIEALAVHFTAGTAAAALLVRACDADPWLLSGGLFLILASLLVAVLRTGRPAFLFPAFLLCGAVCFLTDALSGGGGAPGWADASAVRLRAFIDALPFPSEGTAPLLKALLTGDRSGLSRETTAVFRTSGASHLLALSGLHMGILYLLLSKAFIPLGNSPAAKGFRYGAVLVAAGFFTRMTGASPSIVRAFLFIVLNETARLLHRPRNPLKVLSAALLVQLVLTPSAVTSAGFQLSYLAMAGIFLLYPILEGWYPQGFRHDPVRKVWQAAALSISCQAFTGPLAWYRFHTFPKYFLLTNLLAMPLTTLLMGTAVATLLLSGLGCCPGMLIRATDFLATALVRVLEIISTM